MARILGFIIITAASLALARGQCLTANDDLTSLPTYHDISGIVSFELDLFWDLYMHESQEKNVFISPYSIWSSLLLAYLGSAGRTRYQMETVLGVTDKLESLKTWKIMEYTYRNREIRSFELANRAFIDKRITLEPCFAQFLLDEIEILDLSQTLTASNRINEFIHERTFGKISNLVQPRDLKRAVSVLANAAAFKGFWHVKFSPQDTTFKRFYSSPNDYAIVPMMNLRESFKYGRSQELGAEVLELPYSDGHTSMYIMLPGLTTGPDLGLQDLVSRLTSDNLWMSLSQMWHREVNVTMPKFKLKSAIGDGLTRSLFRLGIKDLFTNFANLTAIAPFGGLTVTNSLHQANIEVDEEGTEASASTIFILTSRTKKPPPLVNFECNRPFLFLIYDTFTRNILFIGTYRNPTRLQSPKAVIAA